ncbi:NnrS family protein [Martelella lutilitoris]|uniref:NnrS family protein n=1 Tax=Martelella lutilitoris TaxID=2583532 RepID=A0A7T7KLQ3_9HYPH|nr:NnrS family protein [Martelella lutilitoris]QQM30753.1 NnrS family protein [Martelella lutilitoris]
MTTMTRLRAWHGPAIFSYGFRPFFFFGALDAALLIALWVPWYLGFIQVPSMFTPVSWHVHELLYGYVPAIIAGFLLTAVPNWTGRLPVVGRPLAGLFGLWLGARAIVAFSASLPPALVYLAALAFQLSLIGFLTREILAGRNWRNLKVIVILSLFTATQILFYYENIRYGTSVYAERAAIALIIMLIQIIGCRVVPSFTRNWLKKQGSPALPPAFGEFDRFVMVMSAAGLGAWIAFPAFDIEEPMLGMLLIAIGAVNLFRQWRWRPLKTLAEPLVFILHLAFLPVSLGFVFAGYAAFTGSTGAESAAIHCWTVGAIGGMTLAIMTRASRGHTGQPLTAPPATVAIYLAIMTALVLRLVAAFNPDWTFSLMPLAGLAWVLAFAGFCVVYGPMLFRPRN